jgi:hypothetical protein
MGAKSSVLLVHTSQYRLCGQRRCCSRAGPSSRSQGAWGLDRRGCSSQTWSHLAGGILRTNSARLATPPRLWRRTITVLPRVTNVNVKRDAHFCNTFPAVTRRMRAATHVRGATSGATTTVATHDYGATT